MKNLELRGYIYLMISVLLSLDSKTMDGWMAISMSVTSSLFALVSLVFILTVLFKK